MGRQARKLSSSGFYHVMFRGINHQHLFEEDRDYKEFLQSLQKLKDEMLFEIHAYCLMSNHVHLLMRENHPGDISQIMRRLLIKYVMYFNQKYYRSGALISNRYKSTTVEVDKYFVPLIRYIHQNPVKAGLAENLEVYQYSSYLEYLYGGNLIDTKMALEIIGKDQWKSFHQILEEGNFDIPDKTNISEAEIRKKIMQSTKGIEPHVIGSWPKMDRDAILKQLREKEGLSIRQIERATGISRGIVAKC
ncbi:MAG: Transposase like protein [Firmicutes bacterium]|nr:Transposase like protein [Bacillota bacterium]MBP2659263.1 Transposase like protein [Bacillota bacterium]